MIGKIAPLVHDVLRDEQITITFVDVGSRNGLLQPADLAPFIEAYGFEPNPAEYAKLLSGSSDAYEIAGIKPPAYRKLEYSPYAISDRSGRATCYVTPVPGACGLLEPDVERLREIIWKGRRYQKNFGDDIFASYQTIDVNVRTIDGWAADKQVDHIDYLKIDAGSILARTGVVKVETCFIPFRERTAAVFGRRSPAARVRIRSSAIRNRAVSDRIQESRRAGTGTAAGLCRSVRTATVVRRGVREPHPYRSAAHHRCPAVLIDKNYLDEALHMLKAKADLDNPALLGILRGYDAGVTTGWWLRGVAYLWVDKFMTAAGRVTRLGRS